MLISDLKSSLENTRSAYLSLLGAYALAKKDPQGKNQKIAGQVKAAVIGAQAEATQLTATLDDAATAVSASPGIISKVVSFFTGS